MTSGCRAEPASKVTGPRDMRSASASASPPSLLPAAGRTPAPLVPLAPLAPLVACEAVASAPMTGEAPTLSLSGGEADCGVGGTCESA